MFLSVTPLREFWDLSDELLFIGSWCAPYDERGELEGLRYRFLPDPWRDHDRFMTAVGACREIGEHFLSQLADYLNGVHGTTHSVRYWRILLNPWLNYHTQQMYGHYVRLTDAFAFEPGLRCVLLDSSQYQTPRDTMDFLRLSFQDQYQLQMLSVLLDTLRPGLPRARRIQEPDLRFTANTTDLARDKGLLRRIIARALGLLTPPGFGEILAIDLNMRSKENLSLVLGSGLKILPYLAQIPTALKPAPAGDERRLGLSRLRGRDEFERALIGAMPSFFPTLYLEGHEGARRYCMDRVRRPPKAIFSAGGWHYNEALKFAAAECSERGSQLWGLQHGGVYGLWEHADAEGFERSIVDRFYCWGWSAGTGDPKLRDLPHPMFSRGAATPGEDVVLVSTTLDFYPTRLIRTQANAQAFDYIAGQARLWTAVSRALPGRAFYRMYPGDLGWRQKERIKDLCPGVRFDDSTAPFSERARSARLLIFDNPMTTFLEAMGADLPCLLTWDPELWRFREEAKPYLERLRETGILFDDFEAAARQAGAIYADPRAWWDEPARRAAHRAFAERFALARADWREVWLKELGVKQ